MKICIVLLTNEERFNDVIFHEFLLCVSVGGMSRPPNKQPAQVKKVAPPSVPEVYRHSGSSFGSAGYSSSEDGCFLPPPDPASIRGGEAELCVTWK